MTDRQIIDLELRERVRNLTERLEADESCLLRNTDPPPEFEVEWIVRSFCSCSACRQWFRRVTQYVAETARKSPPRPMGHTRCASCGKTISAEQTVVAGHLPYCVDCVMTAGADSDRVDASVDMLRPLRDGILY